MSSFKPTILNFSDSTKHTMVIGFLYTFMTVALLITFFAYKCLANIVVSVVSSANNRDDDVILLTAVAFTMCFKLFVEMSIDVYNTTRKSQPKGKAKLVEDKSSAKPQPKCKAKPAPKISVRGSRLEPLAPPLWNEAYSVYRFRNLWILRDMSMAELLEVCKLAGLDIQQYVGILERTDIIIWLEMQRSIENIVQQFLDKRRAKGQNSSFKCQPKCQAKPEDKPSANNPREPKALYSRSKVSTCRYWLDEDEEDL